MSNQHRGCTEFGPDEMCNVPCVRVKGASYRCLWYITCSLTEKTNGVAVIASSREKWHPMISPTPGGVGAAVNEEQRRRFLFRIPPCSLHDDLQLQTRW
ncbi:hypothetical protein Mapa_002679 [Marchantia paleacea]|nr:hypothetical protein Mapa_002679 [Marchantia paleacea]